MIIGGLYFIFTAIGFIVAFKYSEYRPLNQMLCAAILSQALLLLSGRIMTSCASQTPIYSYQQTGCSKSFIDIFIIFVTMVSGLGNSILWIIQFKFLQLCSNEETKQFYRSLIRLFTLVGCIAGAIISSVIFENFLVNTFYTFHLLILIGAAATSWFLKVPTNIEVVQPQSQLQSNNNDNRNELLVYNNNSSSENYQFKQNLNQNLNIITQNDLQQNLIDNNNNQPLESTAPYEVTIQQFNIIIQNTALKYFIPLFILQGLIRGLFWSKVAIMASYSQMPNLYYNQIDTNLGFLFLAAGIAQVASIQITQSQYDAIEDKKLFYYRCLHIVGITYAISFLAWFLNMYILYFLVAALFGYSEVRIRIFSNNIINLKFQQQYFITYCLYNFMQYIGIAVAMLLSAVFSPHHVIMLLTLHGIGLVFCFQMAQKFPDLTTINAIIQNN